MARSRITDTATNIFGNDDGTSLLSFTEREKRTIDFELNSTQFADISQMTITAVLIEGDNDGAGTPPDAFLPTASVQAVPVVSQVGNVFKLYFDLASLITGWTHQPSPGIPTYGFVSVTINDNAAANPQEYELFRGRLEVVYSVGI